MNHGPGRGRGPGYTDSSLTSPNTNLNLRFDEATGLTPQFLERLQYTVSRRVLRHFLRPSLLEPCEVQDTADWRHEGGFIQGAHLGGDSVRNGASVDAEATEGVLAGDVRQLRSL